MSDVDLVKGLYAAFAAGDVAAVLATLDPNIEWVEPDVDAFPYQGVTKGVDAVAGEVLAAIPTIYDRLEFTPERWIAADDTVTVLGQGRAAGRGGEQDFRFAHVLSLRNGRVVRFDGFADTHKLERAIIG